MHHYSRSTCNASEAIPTTLQEDAATAIERVWGFLQELFHQKWNPIKAQTGSEQLEDFVQNSF
jgi:hypothetical protein